MPFSRDLVPPKSHPDNNSFGSRCAQITPGPADQLSSEGSYYSYFVAATAGNVTFTAYADDDATTHTISLLAGQVLPGRVRRVTAATATLLGWFD